MQYRIVATKQYKKAFKKIKNDIKVVSEIEAILELLTTDAPLPKSYKDHQLVGNLKDSRELHIRPDLLLIYQKHEDILVLLLANLGSHSDLF